MGVAEARSPVRSYLALDGPVRAFPHAAPSAIPGLGLWASCPFQPPALPARPPLPTRTCRITRTSRECAASRGCPPSMATPIDLPAAVTRLADGEETSDDAMIRFTLELEFVQLLANPFYLKCASRGCRPRVRGLWSVISTLGCGATAVACARPCPNEAIRRPQFVGIFEVPAVLAHAGVCQVHSVRDCGLWLVCMCCEQIPAVLVLLGNAAVGALS